MDQTTNTRMVYINKGDHENLNGLPKCDSEGLQDNVQHDYAHIDIPPKMPEATTILQMENCHLVPKLKLVSELKHLIIWLSTTFCL